MNTYAFLWEHGGIRCDRLHLRDYLWDAASDAPGKTKVGTWPVGASERMERGDRFYLLRPAKDIVELLAVGRILAGPTWVQQEREPICPLLPNVVFNPHCCKNIPSIPKPKGLRLSNGKQLNPLLTKMLDCAMIDHLRLHVDELLFTAKRKRELPAVRLDDEPWELALDPNLYDILFHSNGYVCDLCGLDHRHVYGRLAVCPQLHYVSEGAKPYAARAGALKTKGLPPIHVLCQNCYSLLGRFPYTELLDKIRPVTCDADNFGIKLKLADADLPS